MSYTVGIEDISKIQRAWYDTERDGACFDEDYFEPNKKDYTLAEFLSCMDFPEDKEMLDRTRMFIHLKDGRKYELKIQDVSPLNSGHFIDASHERDYREKCHKLCEFCKFKGEESTETIVPLSDDFDTEDVTYCMCMNKESPYYEHEMCLDDYCREFRPKND